MIMPYHPWYSVRYAEYTRNVIKETYRCGWRLVDVQKGCGDGNAIPPLVHHVVCGNKSKEAHLCEKKMCPENTSKNVSKETYQYE